MEDGWRVCTHKIATEREGGARRLPGAAGQRGRRASPDRVESYGDGQLVGREEMAACLATGSGGTCSWPGPRLSRLAGGGADVAAHPGQGFATSSRRLRETPAPGTVTGGCARRAGWEPCREYDLRAELAPGVGDPPEEWIASAAGRLKCR